MGAEQAVLENLLDSNAEFIGMEYAGCPARVAEGEAGSSRVIYIRVGLAC